MNKTFLFKLFTLLSFFPAKEMQAQSGVGVGETNPQGIFHVSQPFVFAGVSFTGTGTAFNNLSANISGFTGTTQRTYVIRIQNAGPTPNIIESSSDGGVTFSAPAPISSPIALANGVTATFGTAGGHSFGDQWTFSAGPSFNNTLVVKDGKVGIGTITTNNSAILDINSDNKGILISRLTTLQKNTIPTPAAGLLIYQTDSVPGFYFYNGSAWLNLATSVAGPNANFANQALSNLSTPTSVNRSLIPVSNDSVSVGDTTSNWRNLFMNGSIYNGKNRIINVDTLMGNAFIGTRAGVVNSTGTRNIAIGSHALGSNTSGLANIAIGNGALSKSTNISTCVAIGDSAMYNQSSYSTGNNVAVGYRALYSNTTGNNNIAIGNFALHRNYSGIWNSANGSNSLYNNTTGDNNTASGKDALFNNTAGDGNTAIAVAALYANRTGNDNTAIGVAALHANRTGNDNTAIGVSALYENSGDFNTATGSSALTYNETGLSNTATGSLSLYNNNTGSFNTATGDSALYNNTTAQFNTAVGYKAGANFANGFNNVFLGANADVTLPGVFNAIVIGQSASGTASSQVTIGNSASNSYRIYSTWSNISDGRYKKNIQANVPGLPFINRLKAVTYNLDATGLDAFISRNKMSDSAAYFYHKELVEKEKNIYTGFIAQEVEQAAKESNYNFSGVDAPKNSNDVYGLKYAEFVVPLVKAVQELSDQNEELKKQNTLQQKVNENLQQRLAKLEALVKEGQ